MLYCASCANPVSMVAKGLPSAGPCRAISQSLSWLRGRDVTREIEITCRIVRLPEVVQEHPLLPANLDEMSALHPLQRGRITGQGVRKVLCPRSIACRSKGIRNRRSSTGIRSNPLLASMEGNPTSLNVGYLFVCPGAFTRSTLNRFVHSIVGVTDQLYSMPAVLHIRGVRSNRRRSLRFLSRSAR